MTITTSVGDIVRKAADYFGTKDIFSAAMMREGGGVSEKSSKKQEVLKSLRDEIQSID